MKKHIVCIASFFKGNEFFEECHERGWRVTLVTSEDLLDSAWSWTSLSEVKTVRENATQEEYIRAVTNVAGARQINRIVGIDEFDVLTAAKAQDIFTNRRFKRFVSAAFPRQIEDAKHGDRGKFAVSRICRRIQSKTN